MQQIRTIVAILSIWKYLVTISLVWLLGGFWLYKEGLSITELTSVTTVTVATSTLMILFFIISLVFQLSAIYVLLENNLWNSMLKEAERLNCSKDSDYKKLSDDFGITLGQLFNRPKLMNMSLSQRLEGSMRIAKFSGAIFITNTLFFLGFVMSDLIR